MRYFDSFVVPFAVGAFILFAVVLWKYANWFIAMPRADKKRVARGIFSRHTAEAVGEVISESLLHRRIFRVNPLLGYMHASLAFGWFLLIAVGWIEAAAYGLTFSPLWVHVFFRWFGAHYGLEHAAVWGIDFAFVMDLLLLFVLSGVALAWAKRMRSKMMGMRKTTRHTPGDRIALSALWFIFPARLVAESLTAAIYDNGGFLTGSLGNGLLRLLGPEVTVSAEPVAWWFYSSVLCIFFVAMPFSRYMHIFTEIPLIFLRRYGITSSEKESSFDHFQVEACSRCGICIDPCQLQSQAGYDRVQSVYFLRDRRYGMLTESVAENCLMCGRCQNLCPVGIDLNTLRLNSRDTLRNTPNERRYEYLRGIDPSHGAGKVGYFAGCMTLLTPRTLQAMERIFSAAGEAVWWADREGGVCCGRPLKLAGETDSARRMMEHNTALFRKHGITTLVTSCPICLKVFKEDYDLPGIEILHHSEYLRRLLDEGRIGVEHGAESFTYHDPCELGRKGGIYEPPREVIRSVGELVEPAQTRENALCCGSSVANLAIDDRNQEKIAVAVAGHLEATGADAIVTACPLCKKAVSRGSTRPVYDLSEIVAGHLKESAPADTPQA